MDDVIQHHIEVVSAADGPKARIAGSRVRVQDVAVWHEKLGLTPDAIVDQCPTITLADVHAAMAYYWDHREEIERVIADEQALAGELRRRESGPLEQRLKLSGGG